MVNGLLLQLRSAPIGLRIDEWIRADYPELHHQQNVAAEKQLADNMMALSPQVRKMAPPLIFNANAGMNAAFATFWAKKLEDPRQVVPYVSTGHAERGE